MSSVTDCRDILITGATGYIGRRLAEGLAARGHRVRALVRPQSAGRVTAGVNPPQKGAVTVMDVPAIRRAGIQ